MKVCLAGLFGLFLVGVSQIKPANALPAQYQEWGPNLAGGTKPASGVLPTSTIPVAGLVTDVSVYVIGPGSTDASYWFTYKSSMALPGQISTSAVTFVPQGTGDYSKIEGFAQGFKLYLTLPAGTTGYWKVGGVKK